MDIQLEKIFNTYINRGFYLFPINRKTKRPLIKNMLEEASIDMEVLQAWSKQFGKCNWGLSLAKSKYVAVDVDWKHGGMEAWQTLIDNKGDPETLRATTGSKGFHYLFHADAIRYRGKIQNGIDIKYNGYVVVFPSLHVDTRKMYRWDNWNVPVKLAPTWLKELIEKDELVGKAAPTYKFGNKYLERLVQQLKKCELSYEEWLQAGMAIHASDSSNDGLALYLDLTHGESYEPGDDEQAKIKWESFNERTGGISPLTLGFILRKKGGVVPNPYYEEDKKAFRDAQLAEIEKYKETKGFTSRNGKQVNFNQSEVINHFNERGYAFLIGGGQSPFLRVRESSDGTKDLITMSEKSLKELTAPFFFAQVTDSGDGIKTVLTPAYKEWLESTSRQTYTGIVFKPKAKKTELNLWTQISPLTPLKGGLPLSIHKLILESLCSNDHAKYNWLLDWLAHLIQKPEQRVSTVPVHISLQGSGKGILYDTIMSKILGGQYTMVMTANDLMSRFNLHLTRKFLTFIDEATWRGNKTEDGILKRLIGSPTISVEEKFGMRYGIDNYSRYVIASNNKEAVAVERGNRRYVILEGNDKLSGDADFFDPIMKELEGLNVYDECKVEEFKESIGAHRAHCLEGEEDAAVRMFYGFLKGRDISAFKPHTILKGNKSGAQAKISSEGPIAMFWQDTFTEMPRELWVEDKGLNRPLTYEKFIEYSKSIMTYEKSISSTSFWNKTNYLLGKKLVSKVGWYTNKPTRFSLIDPINFAKRFFTTMEIDIPLDIEAKHYFINEDFEVDPQEEPFEL